MKRGWARQVGTLSSVSVDNFATLVGCGSNIGVSDVKSCVYGQDACGGTKATVFHDVFYLLINTKYHSRRRRPLENYARTSSFASCSKLEKSSSCSLLVILWRAFFAYLLSLGNSLARAQSITPPTFIEVLSKFL